MAIGRALLDVNTRQLAGNALVALGQRDTLLARWRFSWWVAYHVEANLLLGLQADRLDLPWAKAHVVCDTVLPAGGAILLNLHHANSRVGFLRLSETVRPFGVIVAGVLADNATGDEGPREFANVMDPYSRRSRNLRRRVFGGNIFSAQHDVRRALRFLQQDGYLVIQPDARFVGEKRWPMLGKAFPFAEGAVWLSRHSGKPLIPYVVVPTRRGWRVVLGAPIAPTMDDLAAALERCLRAAPTCWHSDYWQAWESMPTWAEYQARLARAAQATGRAAAQAQF
ncbi:MAG TPA: hypothetical protein VIL85_22990 [Thermomicrobiales bacterium]